jgi:hypothetical protein
MKRLFFLFITICTVLYLLISCSNTFEYETVFVDKFQEGVFPTVNYDSTRDSAINSNAQNNDYGASTLIMLGTFSVEAYRYLIGFDISSIFPHNVTVKKACLALYVSAMTVPYVTITAHALTNYFAECTGTESATGDGAAWLERAGGTSWDADGADFSSTALGSPVTVSSTGWFNYELPSDFVESWISDNNSNLGIILKQQTEGGDPHYLQILTNETGSTEQRPKLTVYYSPP